MSFQYSNKKTILFFYAMRRYVKGLLTLSSVWMNCLEVLEGYMQEVLFPCMSVGIVFSWEAYCFMTGNFKLS